MVCSALVLAYDTVVIVSHTVAIRKVVYDTLLLLTSYPAYAGHTLACQCLVISWLDVLQATLALEHVASERLRRSRVGIAGIMAVYLLVLITLLLLELLQSACAAISLGPLMKLAPTLLMPCIWSRP